MSTATPRAQFHQKNLRQPAQHAAVENQLRYERHRPEETTLYRLVQEHIGTFCGILAHGFLRLRCADCTHEKLVSIELPRCAY